MITSRRGWLASLGAAALACVGMGAGRNKKGKTIVRELWAYQEGMVVRGKETKWADVMITPDITTEVTAHPALYKVDMRKSLGSVWNKNCAELSDMHVGESRRIRLTIEMLD